MPDGVVSDRSAKRGLAVSIVVGSVLGFWWGAPRYGAIHVSTWNLMGLGVIAVVFFYAAVLLARAAIVDRRLRREQAPAPGAER
jgi:hypothetical protein